MGKSNYMDHKQANEKILMEAPDGTFVEVMRKRVPIKIKWGWKIVPPVKTKEKNN